MGSFTQEMPGQDETDWQAPWDETILDERGEEIVADGLDATGRPEFWKGQVRLAFFFHFLDLERPLRTPFGEVLLPEPSPRPPRLQKIEYEEP